MLGVAVVQVAVVLKTNPESYDPCILLVLVKFAETLECNLSITVIQRVIK